MIHSRSGAEQHVGRQQVVVAQRRLQRARIEDGLDRARRFVELVVHGWRVDTVGSGVAGVPLDDTEDREAGRDRPGRVQAAGSNAVTRSSTPGASSASVVAGSPPTNSVTSVPTPGSSALIARGDAEIGGEGGRRGFAGPIDAEQLGSLARQADHERGTVDLDAEVAVRDAPVERRDHRIGVVPARHPPDDVDHRGLVDRPAIRSSPGDRLDEPLDVRQVGGERDRALRPLEQVGEVRRQLRAHTRRPLDGVGELGRMGRGQRDDRVRRSPSASRRCRGGRGVRIDQHPGLALHAGDLVERRVVVGAGGPERAVDPLRPLVGLERRGGPWPGTVAAARPSARRRAR